MKRILTLCALLLGCTEANFNNDFSPITIEFGKLGNINNVIEYYDDGQQFILCRRRNELYGVPIPLSIYEDTNFARKIQKLAELQYCKKRKSDLDYDFIEE